MTPLRRIVIAWMMLWLAGNGALAAVMPFCKHTLAASVESVVVQHQAHEMQQASADHDHHPAGQQHGSHAEAHQTANSGMGCDNCNLCHLGASLLPADVLSGVQPVPDRAYQPGPVVVPASRFPDQPFHVPLSRRA